MEHHKKIQYGKDNSKQEILCFYCDEPMRKDNLTRHCELVHNGKTPKHKEKKLLGQTSLMGYLSNKPSISKEPSLAKNEHAEQEFGCNSQDLKYDKCEGSDIEEGNSKVEEPIRKVRKRQLPESEDEEYDKSKIKNVESDQTKYTNPQFAKLKDDIVDAVALLLSKTKVDSAVSGPSNTSEQDDNEHYSECGLSKADILLCKDFRALHTLLLEKGNFTVDLENDVIVCRLCCESDQSYFF